jgi:hypothetical protein
LVNVTWGVGPFEPVKFVPVTEIKVPIGPDDGLNPDIVGAGRACETVATVVAVFIPPLVSETVSDTV